MAQVVIPKTSSEAISMGGSLKVGGLLKIIGINDNKIISEIPNSFLVHKIFGMW